MNNMPVKCPDDRGRQSETGQPSSLRDPAGWSVTVWCRPPRPFSEPDHIQVNSPHAHTSAVESQAV